ncbi:MAG: hypothetical protein JRI53_08425 [Deltaproteobacteria bacterium]|nr:hypothetical protein [Deltaproteobacteria bacterium]
MIQRVIEAAGISTISVSLSKEITGSVRPPRAIYPGFPLGHPISFPGQISRQLSVMRLLLKHLEEMDTPGTIIELDLHNNDG